MNIPTRETLRSEALEVRRLAIEFALETRSGNADAAKDKAAEISRMVQKRPVLEAMATDAASNLIENAGTFLGEHAKVGL